jgi:RNA polymerase sigma factor (TIGR02999 family)
LTSIFHEATLLPKNSEGRSGGSLSQVQSSRVQSKIVKQLLDDWHAGEDEALHALVPLVYAELRRVAHQYLRRERAGHTLQSTALVHEAYLRLEKQGAAKFENRAHFLAICARLMRQILVDYGRSRNTAKRDGGDRVTNPVTLDGLAFKSRTVDIVALDDALQELAKLDQQQSRIVELRFFGGLSIEETSDVLKLSPRTVKRHWASARAWLHHEISATSGP